MTTFLARLPRAKPAPLERIRCAIARHVFRRRMYGYRLCVLLVPRDHPWSVVVRSAYEDVSELTDLTLWPRDPETGTPSVDRGLKHGRRIWRGAWMTPLTIWLVLDVMSTHVPGPIGPFTDLDEDIRVLTRFSEAVSAFFGA
jgi:hypothetical protein